MQKGINSKKTKENGNITIFPISKIQHQFWLINQFYPQSPAYNIPSVFKITGSLNIPVLEKSINEIINRHQILRTTFRSENGETMQVVHNHLYLNIEVSDFRNTSTPDQLEIDNFIRDEISQHFDLQQGPLMRLKLFIIKNEEFIFCITMYHIIVDLHSKDMFADEVSSVYNAIINKLEIPPSNNQYQYSDYSLWEKQWFNDPQFNRMLSYWKEKLKGADDFLHFPADHPRPALLTLKGHALPVMIPKSFTELLKNFSQNNSVILFVILLSAYYVLLYKYTYQTSIIIGVPLTNRRNDAHKKIMGCFMNIVPLLVNISDEKNFKEVIQDVRKAMLEAHRNQEVPFEEIVNQLRPHRSPSFNPLFQVGFAFEHPMEIDLAGLNTASLPVHAGGSQLDLFATLWETTEGIKGRIEFNTDLFENISISNLIENYLILIEELIANSEKPLSQVSIKYRDDIYSASVSKTDDSLLKRYSSIYQLIEPNVKKYPDKAAVLFNDSSLSYKEIDARSNQLAHYLLKLGVQKESLVGVYIERSMEMLVGLLGIHKAGGAYIPLDPDFPKNRIKYMIDHSKLMIILSHSKLVDSIPDSNARIISLDKEWQEISKESIDAPIISINDDNLAYVMYTSGSTGNPKGVQITHKSVINFLISMSKEPGMSAEDILFAVTTISFDISVLELFLPLTVGAATVIIPKEISMDGKLLVNAMLKYEPTIMQATPTTWRILFASAWNGSKKLKVLCGGEAMPRDLGEKLFNSVSSVWNMYGPTETAIWSTVFKIQNPNDPIYIGKPIDSTQIYILDGSMQRVPTGVIGEIYIGGAGVARGYLNDPHLTEERFIKDTFSNSNGFIYKTGDIGRFAYNGNIEFYNRIDSQVKVRGFRIELSEIEFNLSHHEQISNSAVAIKKDHYGNNRIIGYIVPRDKKELNIASIRQFLLEYIPNYMVPDIFVILETLPLTPNGKIDRKSLPEPSQSRLMDEGNYVSPRNKPELKISTIWKDVLNLDKVGIYDNFFDLGGNSLLAVEIVNRINIEFDSDISIILLFKYPTVDSMAKYLTSSGEDNDLLEKAKGRAKKQQNAYISQKKIRGEGD